jgi:glycosyltransferase involved in cell wall biosynthesis
MRILIVHNPYQQYGGEDSVVKAEKELMESRGEEVLLYSRHNDEIKQFNILQKAAFFPQTVYSPRTEGDMARVVREFRPQVAFIHNVYPLISPSVYHALHSLGVPTLQVLHNFRPFCTNGLFYIEGEVCELCKHGNYFNAVSRKCYKDNYALSALYATTMAVNRSAGLLDKISGFICLTEFFRIKMREIGIPERQLFVRPNFVKAPPLSSDTANRPGDYILFMGRLSAEKGVSALLRAFESVRNLPLKILGTGPAEAELRSFVRDKQLSNVELLGFKSGDEKWDLLRNARALILPSEWYENFPVTVLEAYMASRPVLAARIGGLPYIVEDGKTGLLFEPADVKGMAARIEQIFHQPEQAVRMGAYGRQLVETRYSPDEGYENLMKIFRQVQAA